MQIELLPGLDNVIRFPVEQRARPTLALVREIAPDSREVSLVAESFGLEETARGMRDRVDQKTAEHILNALPREPDEARTAELHGMLAPLVRAAVEACRASHDASHLLRSSQERVLAAQAAGSLWAEQLGEHADRLSQQSAELLLAAHARCEEVEGAARAVGMALRGETWAPYEPREAGEWLASGGHPRR